MNTPADAQSAALQVFQSLSLCPAPDDAGQGPLSSAWRPVAALLAQAENTRCFDAALHQLVALLAQAATCLPDEMKPGARASARRFLEALAADCRAMLDRPELAAQRFPRVFGLAPVAPAAVTPPWWTVLRVERSASRAAITAAYRRRRSECHPDKGGTAAEFRDVALAYRVAMT